MVSKYYQSAVSKYAIRRMGLSKELISKILMGNWFHIKLHILRLENWKQSLWVKSWKGTVRAEKAKNSRLKWTNH